jgi:hypothetical protein
MARAIEKEKAGQDVEDPDRPGETVAASPRRLGAAKIIQPLGPIIAVAMTGEKHMLI